MLKSRVAGAVSYGGSVVIGLSAGKSPTGSTQHDQCFCKIKSAYEALVAEGKKPSHFSIAKKSGISRTVVRDFFKNYPMLCRNMPLRTIRNTGNR